MPTRPLDHAQAPLAGVHHEPPKVAASHKIEIPASMAHRLTPEQAELLQAHASAHGDSRHQLAHVEKVGGIACATLDSRSGTDVVPLPFAAHGERPHV